MAEGVGEASGGITVLNAIPTMIGGAASISLKVRALVRLADGYEGFSIVLGDRVPIERGILESVSAAVERLTGYRTGFRAIVESEVPVASGLKSSSSLVVALVKGLAEALGERVDCVTAALAGVEASRRAGITITGAYDDHIAASCGGVYITDNERLRVLRRYEPGGLQAVIWVPPSREEFSIGRVDASAFRGLRGLYYIAAETALRGDWLRAATINGVLTSMATGVGWREVREVLVRGLALAAGVTGKGPSVFAITRSPEEVERLWRGLEGMIIVASLG